MGLHELANLAGYERHNAKISFAALISPNAHIIQYSHHSALMLLRNIKKYYIKR